MDCFVAALLAMTAAVPYSAACAVACFFGGKRP